MFVRACFVCTIIFVYLYLYLCFVWHSRCMITWQILNIFFKKTICTGICLLCVFVLVFVFCVALMVHDYLTVSVKCLSKKNMFFNQKKNRRPMLTNGTSVRVSWSLTWWLVLFSCGFLFLFRHLITNHHVKLIVVFFVSLVYMSFFWWWLLFSVIPVPVWLTVCGSLFCFRFCFFVRLYLCILCVCVCVCVCVRFCHTLPHTHTHTHTHTRTRTHINIPNIRWRESRRKNTTTKIRKTAWRDRLVRGGGRRRRKRRRRRRRRRGGGDKATRTRTICSECRSCQGRRRWGTGEGEENKGVTKGSQGRILGPRTAVASAGCA